MLELTGNGQSLIAAATPLEAFVNLGFEARSFAEFAHCCHVAGFSPEDGLRRFHNMRDRDPEMFELVIEAFRKAFAGSNRLDQLQVEAERVRGIAEDPRWN